MRKWLTVLSVVVFVLGPGMAWAKEGSSHGDGHGGGDHGGGGEPGGGGNPGGGGEHSGGTTGGGAVSAPSVSVSSAGGPTGAIVSPTYTSVSTGDRAKLVSALKACTWDRLATYDTTVYGGWSVRTFDDAQWPVIYRCMKAKGYQPSGPDYTQQTNFGARK